MEESASPLRPVAAIGPSRLRLTSNAIHAEMPLFASTPEWDAPDPARKWVMIMVHGRQRNADEYLAFAQKAAPAGGLIIAPQFLTLIDTAHHQAPDDLLRWRGSEWMGGGAACNPAKLSGFTALDALVRTFADRETFPALETIIVAGHSGGGQVVQRYALLTAATDRVRFVIANPSSYAYLSADRPAGNGAFAPPDPERFPGFNKWKYGLEARPDYGADIGDEPLEQRYVTRDITYILGQADCDPAHPALDTSLAAQAQGANRLARGRGYFEYLTARHGAALRHRLIEVPGIGHNPSGIFGWPPVRDDMFKNF